MPHNRRHLTSPSRRGLDSASPLTDGGVIKQIWATRAYAQQLVTTRLLDCLHDPVARLSRMQRIHPSALSNCYPAITSPDFYERGVMPC